MYVQVNGRTRAVSDRLVERIARGLHGAVASQSREELRTIQASDIAALRKVRISMDDDEGAWGSDELIAAVMQGLAR